MARGLLVDRTCQLDVLAGSDTAGDIDAALERYWFSHPEVPDDVRRDIGAAALRIGAALAGRRRGGWPVRMRMSLRCFSTVVQMMVTDDGDPVDPDGHIRQAGGRLRYHSNRFGNHWTVSACFGAQL